MLSVKLHNYAYTKGTIKPTSANVGGMNEWMNEASKLPAVKQQEQTSRNSPTRQFYRSLPFTSPLVHHFQRVSVLNFWSYFIGHTPGNQIFMSAYVFRYSKKAGDTHEKSFPQKDVLNSHATTGARGWFRFSRPICHTCPQGSWSRLSQQTAQLHIMYRLSSFITFRRNYKCVQTFVLKTISEELLARPMH